MLSVSPLSRTQSSSRMNRMFIRPVLSTLVYAIYSGWSTIVRTLPTDGPIKPTQADQLEFYALFKQGHFGDVTTSRPGMLDFVGRPKWDAWNNLKTEGVTKEEARKRYVEKLIGMLEAAGDEQSKASLEILNAL
ncbi:ACBP-domain-containing protein [Serendipita vermifera]|nr:ACBP-domain-containing protein [Serendipita vermifera]